jgi:hypothetical protein
MITPNNVNLFFWNGNLILADNYSKISGRSGAICPEILSFSVERDLLTESFLISLVRSSFKRSGSFSNTHVNIRLFHISNHVRQTS